MLQREKQEFKVVIFCVCEVSTLPKRETETERERDTERETDRETDRQRANGLLNWANCTGATGELR